MTGTPLGIRGIDWSCVEARKISRSFRLVACPPGAATTFLRRQETIVAGQRRKKEVRKHTLHHESIAMENPLYVPKVVWPTAEPSGSHGSTVNPNDWVIPESSTTSLYIPSSLEETNEDGCGC